MFAEGKKLEVIGKFHVVDINGEYIQLDPFEFGQVDMSEKYEQNGFTEIDKDGNAKEFDGFQLGDFISLNGQFKVVRSNDIFTKFMVGEQLVSVPNHKLLEVE
ncbi:MAG TPA: hypothetical protein VK118_06190 [Tetragenococcus sp.]|nr:hypothetical protein [Tetragenococcus sp.]